MTPLNPELCRAVREAAGAPVRLTDPETQQNYVLLRAEVFEKAKALFVDEEVDPAETYAAFEQVAGPAGWHDPEMDVYEKYREKP